MLSSKYNALIKLVRSLEMKKYRDEHGLFVIEGDKFVRDALAANYHAEYLLISETYTLEHAVDFEAVSLTDALFATIAKTKTPQGIMGVFRIPQITFSKVMDKNRILFLNGVQNSDNVGALIRSAVCAGYGAVIMDETTADIYSDKAVRASAGALLNIACTHGTVSDLLLLKENGYMVIASALDGYADCDITADKSVLIVGNEGSGISSEVKQICDCLVKIPIYGAFDSLNVACAGTLLMYKTVGY